MKTEELIFLKKCELEQTNFLIFKDCKGNRRLLEESGYGAFNLKTGMKVMSVIRSRGCSGQEIEELLHPVYKKGECYQFTIASFRNISLNDDIVQVVTMLGADGEVYKTRVNNNYSLAEGHKIFCKLLNQKKGRLNFCFERFAL